MKYPKIKAEWQPISNPEIDIKSQEVKYIRTLNLSKSIL